MLTHNDGLANRALAKATGGNIHDVRVLVAYYRNAVEIHNAYLKAGKDDPKAEDRCADIRKYERLLDDIARTGRFPGK